ncbi:hypothetical protein KBD71_03335 [Candidatus Woesebacteria bacterium]|nr:hypothetical protein [Candidatus Woesebacteria bacterium]
MISKWEAFQAYKIAELTQGLIALQQFDHVDQTFVLDEGNVINFAISMLNELDRQLGEGQLLFDENEVLDVMLLTQKLLSAKLDPKSPEFKTALNTGVKEILAKNDKRL